jgi:hypothetical protein
MPRIPMRHAATRWIFALGLITCLLPAPQPIVADEIILVGVPLLRKFPADWCPLPIAMQFISSGDHADIYVTANNYVFDGSEFFHAHQAIDNMVVVRDSIYALPQYLRDNTLLDSPFHSCYTSGGTTVPSIFKFDLITPADAPLYELFESPPVGWDLTQGAYYQTPGSAPLNPSSDQPVAGIGSLGLGQTSPTPSLADSARTSVRVNGLIGSKAYVLTGWWIADGSAINVTDQVSLTIKIIGPDLVPLAQKTWGNLKARYR